MKALIKGVWYTVESFGKLMIVVDEQGNQSSFEYEAAENTLSDLAYDKLKKKEQKALECREVNQVIKSQEIHAPVITVSQVPVILERVNNS